MEELVLFGVMFFGACGDFDLLGEFRNVLGLEFEPIAEVVFLVEEVLFFGPGKSPPVSYCSEFHSCFPHFGCYSVQLVILVVGIGICIWPIRNTPTIILQPAMCIAPLYRSHHRDRVRGVARKCRRQWFLAHLGKKLLTKLGIELFELTEHLEALETTLALFAELIKLLELLAMAVVCPENVARDHDNNPHLEVQWFGLDRSSCRMDRTHRDSSGFRRTRRLV